MPGQVLFVFLDFENLLAILFLSIIIDMFLNIVFYVLKIAFMNFIEKISFYKF